MMLLAASGQLNRTLMQYLHMLFPRTVGINDVVDVIIISFIIYQILCWIQLTRAWTLFKGIMLLLFFSLIASWLHLDTIYYILSKSLGVGIMALIVIFQPELRNALEQLGRRNILTNLTSLRNLRNLNIFADDILGETGTSERTIGELVRACSEMSATKTGALIVIEQTVALGEYERTGIPVDALVSSQLLVNIFEKNTPLHDGAVIVRGNRVVSATCYLPLTDSLHLGKELGTRHRAAVGISEVSDSITIVVSEENGAVSLAQNGRLVRHLSSEDLYDRLHSNFENKGETDNKSFLDRWKGLLRNEKSTKQ